MMTKRRKYLPRQLVAHPFLKLFNRSTDSQRRIFYGDVYVKLLSLGSSSRTAEETCVLYLLLWNLNLKEAVRNGWYNTEQELSGEFTKA